MNEWLYLAVLSLAGARLYRMGGDARRNTLWRDLGVPACAVLALVAFGIKDWSLAVSFILLFGAMTTYFGFVNKWFGRDEQESWINWLLIGLSYNIALLPTVWKAGLWKGFYIRLLVLPAIFVASDFLIDWFHSNVKNIPDKAVPKEYCRGFFTVCTIPILFIK